MINCGAECVNLSSIARGVDIIHFLLPPRTAFFGDGNLNPSLHARVGGEGTQLSPRAESRRCRQRDVGLAGPSCRTGGLRNAAWICCLPVPNPPDCFVLLRLQDQRVCCALMQVCSSNSWDLVRPGNRNVSVQHRPEE